MRRMLAFILSLVLCFSLNNTVYAEEINTEANVGLIFTQNEYDIFVALKQTPKNMLESSGYSYETIEAIQSFSIEEAVLERANLSDQELLNMGYSERQISLLRTYDGSPIEQNPQMRGVFADLTGQIQKESAGKTRMKVSFTWEWSNSPFLNGSAISDIVTCGFAATNDDNLSSVITVESATCSVDYYVGTTKMGTLHPTVTYKNPQSHIEVKFQHCEEFTDGQGFLQSGKLQVTVKEESTVNELYSVSFAFGYGHTVFTVSPSISVSVGGGITGGVGLSFGFGTENMFYKTMILKHDGTYQIFDGG